MIHRALLHVAGPSGDVFDDVIGISGNRVPITAVVANLKERADVGLRRCVCEGQADAPLRLGVS